MRSVGLKVGGKHMLMVVALFALALVLAGCAGMAGANQSGGTASAPTAAATSAPEGTMAPEATAPEATVAPEATAPEATTAPDATTESGAGPAGAAVVMVTADDALGDILTDDKGMTLYLFTKDTPDTSTCYDQCAERWPPLLTTGAPTAGEGAESSLLGTATRTDGTTQVTYNGWPLYYWWEDKAPGDTTGQDVGGVWFVVSPEGEMVETPAG